MRQARNVPRPLSARSLVASTLLGCHPPQLPVQPLVKIGELFGVAEGTIRVALSRMVSAGELEAVDGEYRLVGRLVGRQARQEEGWHPTRHQWGGMWTTAVVVAEGRRAPDRAELRAAMTALRLAELRDGVWLRPANLDLRRLPAAWTVVDAQCRWFDAHPPGNTRGSQRLAAELWDVNRWARNAQELRRQMDRIVGRLEAGDHAVLAPASLASAAVMRHFLADPLLPADLLPGQWPGEALRTEYDRFESALRRLLRTWIREHRGESP